MSKIEKREKDLTNQDSEISSYHFCVPKGWINDPNGLIYFDNKYHIFYQYNPNENHWNKISIGVAESDDLLIYKNFNVALAPTKEVDGIFSGSVTSSENGINLIFTKHIEKPNLRKESISAGFLDENNKIITDFEELIDLNLYPDIDIENFRDPFVYREKDTFYLFIASRDKEINRGKVVVFKSKSLKNFKFAFEIGPLEVFGDMVECPAVGKIGDDYILVYSYIEKAKDKDLHKTGYLVLNMDLENDYFAILKCGKIDNSLDFYAPQLFATKDNELGLISWFNSWDYKPIEQENNIDSCGLFTYPRILSLDHGLLIQKPYKEIMKKVKRQYQYDNGLIPTVSLIKLLAFDEFKIDFVDENGISKLELLYFKDKLFLKTNEIVSESIYKYKDLTLLIMLDKTSCEIFVNHGKETISRRVFFNSSKIKLNITKREHISNLLIAELNFDE